MSKKGLESKATASASSGNATETTPLVGKKVSLTSSCSCFTARSSVEGPTLCNRSVEGHHSIKSHASLTFFYRFPLETNIVLNIIS